MVVFPRRHKRGYPIYGSDEVTDVTGAGDTVIATFTCLARRSAKRPPLANYAGGIVVMKRGTATVSCEELLEALQKARQWLANTRVASLEFVTEIYASSWAKRRAYAFWRRKQYIGLSLRSRYNPYRCRKLTEYKTG